jgi:glycosyltransferase involved in cell wall biosynthesis
MKILLLYNGYPRLSQTYQIDEAKQLKENGHEIMIISWKWELYTIDNSFLPYIHDNPMNLINKIKRFKPDIVHTHYLDNVEIAHHFAMLLNIKFSVRTHSFDILEQDCKKNLLNNLKIINKINSFFCSSIIIFPEFVPKLKDKKIKEEKIISCFPSINIKKFQNVFSLPNGNDIMSGGAFLPKKNIKDFILLAKKIKETYPNKNVRYYSVKEEPSYYDEVINFNKKNGSPVEFVTKQPEEMPLEYKKHQYLIYSACPLHKSVGLPLMVAEAQASGVGVIMYKLRDELKEYVTENGFLYETHEDVLDILEKPFDEVKKNEAFKISDRYDIERNIKNLEQKWIN